MSLDRSVILLGNDLDAILQLPPKWVSEAIQDKSMNGLFDHARTLRQVGQMSGAALAHLLYLWQDNWDWFVDQDMVDDEFENVVQAVVGISPQTTGKYVRMWRAVFVDADITQEEKRRLLSWPTENLLLAAPAIAGGLSRDQWEELLGTHDKAEIRKFVRGTRGSKTSAGSALHLRVKRDGTLHAWKGGKRPVVVGFLRRSKADLEDEMRRAAYMRILSGAGIEEE